MNNLNIKIKLLRPDARVPEYATDGAAAVDLRAALDSEVVLNPGERRLIPTGIAIAPADDPSDSSCRSDGTACSTDGTACGADGTACGTDDKYSGASFAAIICARSGLASRLGLALANGIGVVDEDYRGEIQVSMINLGNEPVTIAPGERIAQLMFVPVMHASFLLAQTLPETTRQSGGFGSTGTK